MLKKMQNWISVYITIFMLLVANWKTDDSVQSGTFSSFIVLFPNI
jgi:hypothetical protein